MSSKIIHLVDDEYIIHDIFKRIFREPEYQLIISENKSHAKANHHPEVDVLIMDLMIPGSSGIEIFSMLKKDDPDIQCIFLTAYGTIESAIEAIKLGAVDYLQKPFNNVEIKHKIERIFKERNTNRENIQLKKMLGQRFSFKNIIGKSRALERVLSHVESVANTNSTVLISGDSGTGKELIAKAIYRNSNRKDKPFFSFNSSNIPPTLFESILFGYKKGAFTGAYADKKGIFEEAHTGTLFLDEKNEFREDLYYRLNIINIHLPPLKERKEDIPLLADHFMQKYAEENNKVIAGMDTNFMKCLMDYHWPGNIRELENALIRSVLLAPTDMLTADLLPEEILGARKITNRKGDFYERLDELKRELILEALRENEGVQKNAAQALGLKATTLSELMKRLNIK